MNDDFCLLPILKSFFVNFILFISKYRRLTFEEMTVENLSFVFVLIVIVIKVTFPI